MTTSFVPYDVAVAGAGISGLACAWTLRQAGLRVVVLEAAADVGGCISTIRRGGCIADGGPQTFVPSGPFSDLSTSVGLERSVQSARAGSPYLFAHGRLVAVPTSPLKFLRSPLLSPFAKLRLLAEPFIGARVSDADEPLAEFAARRGGRAIVDAIVKPMVGGIFGGDPAQLSARSAFPALVEAERRYTSVMIGAAIRRPAGGRPRRQPPVSIAGGNDGLPRAIAARLAPDVRLGARVTELILRGAGIELAYEGASSGSVVARHAVLALPAWASAALLERVEPDAAAALLGIPYVPMAQVALAYPRDNIGAPLDGFGFLSGERSGLRILGCVWNSAMFEDRSPADKAVFTAFLGGALDREAPELPDHELVRIAHEDISRALVIRDTVPSVVAGFRWERVIPQYDVGHLERLATIAKGVGRLDQVTLVGNFFSGASVPECIAVATAAANRLAPAMNAR